MKYLPNLVVKLYRQVIRLYPSNFRVEFGDEMFLVFKEHILHSAQAGWGALLQAIGRELWAAPGEIGAAYWDLLSPMLRSTTFLVMLHTPPTTHEPRRLMMADDVHEPWQMKTKREMFIACLPASLLGIGIASTSLIRGGPWYSVPTWRLALSIAVPLIFVLTIAITGLVALFRRIPDWGITWVATGAMGFLLLLETGAEELAEVGKFLISESGDMILMAALLLAGLVLLSLLALRGWHRAGLFSIALSTTLTLALYMSVTAAPFYRHDLAIYAAPMGLAISTLTYLYVHGSKVQRVIMLIALAGINATAPLLLNHAMREWFARQGSSPTWPLVILLTGLLLSGPLVSLLSKPFLRFMKPS